MPAAALPIPEAVFLWFACGKRVRIQNHPRGSAKLKSSDGQEGKN
jgi:hypothetical protein